MDDHERQQKVHVILDVVEKHLGQSALILISAGLNSWHFTFSICNARLTAFSMHFYLNKKSKHFQNRY